MYSVLIRGGRILDGTGNPYFRGDIAVEGDTIVAIGKVPRGAKEEAQVVIDAQDLIVSPGFIDIHTHSDRTLLDDGRAESHIMQGVTTAVVGNCGGSAAPLTDATAARIAGETRGGVSPPWRGYAQFMSLAEEQGISMNMACLVGQGTIRGAVMGYEDRPATEAELDAMKDMVRKAMDDGCLGMSTGLIYTPGCYAQTPEIVELAKVAAGCDGVYASHVRGENDTLISAIEEAIDIGRRAGAPVQIAHLKAMGTHMWGKSVDILRMIDDARKEGVEVTFDQYPYNASATGLAASLPPWAQIGGRERFMERLRDPDTRAKMRHDMEEGTGDWFSLLRGVGWENIILTGASDPRFAGKSVAEIAKERCADPFDTCFDILLESGGMVGCVYFTIGDEDLERIMRHVAGMVGSDSSAVPASGPLAVGKPHPRSFGTFVRVLGHYVREKKVISLEEAVRKMTMAPAQKMRLYDRGLLRPGMKADLVMFDPDSVTDKATYMEPRQFPAGIHAVFVNGKLTVKDGKHLGVMNGRVLRKGRFR